MIISMLCPTRGRPSNIMRLVSSAITKAVDSQNLEFVFYLDDDDQQGLQGVDDAIAKFPSIKIVKVIGPRIVLSQMWNACLQQATGEIFMHCGDDIEFITPNWDHMIREAFTSCEDKILFVHGTDGWNNENFGTHGFLHKNWVDTVGYFVPPIFSSDYNDTWLNDVADKIQRRFYVPVHTEHYHPQFNKGIWDRTHIERLARHRKDKVEDLYKNTEKDRQIDALKLQNRILQFQLEKLQKSN